MEIRWLFLSLKALEDVRVRDVLPVVIAGPSDLRLMSHNELPFLQHVNSVTPLRVLQKD